MNKCWFYQRYFLFSWHCSIWFVFPPFHVNISICDWKSNLLCVYAKHKIQSNFMPFEYLFVCVRAFFLFVLLMLTRLRWCTLVDEFDYLSPSIEVFTFNLLFESSMDGLVCRFSCMYVLFLFIFYCYFMFKYNFVIKNEIHDRKALFNPFRRSLSHYSNVIYK